MALYFTHHLGTETQRDRLIPGLGKVLMGEYLLGVIFPNQEEFKDETIYLNSEWFGESMN